MTANGIGLNAVVMLHAIRKSGRTSNAHGWHPCSVVARQLRFSPCYKIVAALNRMFGRCTTDSVTELKQSCDFVRLLFLITVECCRSGGLLAQKPIKRTTAEHSTNVH